MPANWRERHQLPDAATLERLSRVDDDQDDAEVEQMDEQMDEQMELDLGAGGAQADEDNGGRAVGRVLGSIHDPFPSRSAPGRLELA